MLKRPLNVYDDLSDYEDGQVVSSSSSESEAESDQEFLVRPVLPVAKFDASFRESDEPSSGEQYLCLVRHERKKLPQTEVAKTVVVGSLKSVEELLSGFAEATCVKELDATWAENFWNSYRLHDAATLALFDSVSQVNVKLPGTKDQSEWLAFLQENEPSTEICVALQEEQDVVMKLIQHYTHWIQSSTYTELTWLSSLLLCLDRKLSSQQIFQLRKLAKALSYLTDNEKANELILVIAKIYGQHDLIVLK